VGILNPVLAKPDAVVLTGCVGFFVWHIKLVVPDVLRETINSEMVQACKSAETSMRGMAKILDADCFSEEIVLFRERTRIFREAIAKAEGKMNHDNEPDKEPK
jgi:hypothetical protein